MSTLSLTEFVAPRVLRLPVAFVNTYAVGTPGGAWVLVDTGLPGTAPYVRQRSEGHYGRPPEAIVLTHGHFDHAGNALALAGEWNVPVYAHEAELPFLTGRSDYPPADSSMGGAIAQLARLFPTGGYDFGDRVRALPEDGSVPHLPGWRWLHTPGHTPGHVSLWRAADRTLLAGDALATMDLDSWASQATHRRELDRPPVPFTPDWDAADASIHRLAGLRPDAIGAGHGRALSGPNLANQLVRYATVQHRPDEGRYVPEPAHFDRERGTVYVPPPVPDRALPRFIAGVGVLAGGLLLLGTRK
jgi:glyoxylase-like metal-dependent hydrolase (beta-lactamase superfamily II)